MKLPIGGVASMSKVVTRSSANTRDDMNENAAISNRTILGNMVLRVVLQCNHGQSRRFHGAPRSAGATRAKQQPRRPSSSARYCRKTAGHQRENRDDQPIS